MRLVDLNQMGQHEFVESVGAIFEHSPWVAETAWGNRPFASVPELHETMVNIVKEAEVNKKLDLIRAHPDLAARTKMTSESVQEQKSAGLDQISTKAQEELLRLNSEYKNKFDFPFILAVRGKNNLIIKQSMQERIENDQEVEFETALQEIYKIAQFRLEDLLSSK